MCPQRLPDISNETAALERMPKGRLEYLKRLLPFLKNQSEDCLYLNVYAPIQGKKNKIYVIGLSEFLPWGNKCETMKKTNRQDENRAMEGK